MLEILDPAAAEAAKLAKAAPAKARGGAPRRGSVSSESIDPKKQVNVSEIPIVEKAPEVIARIEGCIKGHLLFKDIDAETRRTVILSMTERRLAAGEAVITQGEDGDFFYIVDSGTLECFVKTKGEEGEGQHGRLVMTYTTGKNFGELALMYNTPRAATIVAASECVLWAIGRDVFRSLILATYMRKRQHFESILETVPLLQSMNRYERSVLADAFEEQDFPAQSEIIHEGDEGSNFYILTEGECIATQTDGANTEQEVKNYHAGEYFGELALLRETCAPAARPPRARTPTPRAHPATPPAVRAQLPPGVGQGGD